MQTLQGICQGNQIEATALLSAERIRPLARQRKHLLDQTTEPIRSDPFREWIHSKQAPDPIRLHRSISTFQHLDQRILKGEPIASVLHQTTHRHGAPRQIEPLPPLEIGLRR